MRCGRYAAIDIGTVTCRMLVIDVGESGLRELTREYAITNLGEGVDATGELKPEAMERVVRDARNAAEFAARLRERGIELSVIPGSREAALSFSGASIDFSGERLMVVDVGGGSTEVVMGTGGAEPVCAHSFNVGCRRVTEKFLASDPPAPEELARARAWIREQMASWFADQAKEAADLERVVAVAGTATTVVSIRDRMETYDSSRVHKARVSRQELLEVYERLAALPLSARKNVVGLDPKRAPVMVAGLLILLEVLDFAGIDAFTVSETDILHGITLAVSHEACEKSCL